MRLNPARDDEWRPEPLSLDDVEPLVRIVEIGGIWRDTLTFVPMTDELPGYVASALRRQAAGRDEAYTIRRRRSGEIVGTTRLQEIDLIHRRAQIGSTWIGTASRRCGASSASKCLLLERAFRELRLERVDFLVHPMNRASRIGIERTGARLEGVLRAYVNVRGRQQDRCLYALVRSDWVSANPTAAGLSAEPPT